MPAPTPAVTATAPRQKTAAELAETQISLPLDAPSARPPAPGFVPERIWGDGKAMGTHINFACYTTPQVTSAKAREAFAAALVEFARLEGLMTTWRDSEIAQANVQAGTRAVHLGPDAFAVVDKALAMSERSQGAFDITFETLHGLWKFDEDLDPHPPTAAAVAARLPLVGYSHVALDRDKQEIFIKTAGTKIGLGGIAKGYAVDKAAAVLRQAGLQSFLVQAGGDLMASGRKPDGSEWVSGIRDPRGPAAKYFAVLPISDRAFSTAGDYERSYVVGGKRYHHILDPRTGFPATLCKSVTVWAKTAFEADAIDDAVFVLGPEKGLELVESFADVGAVIVDAKDKIWVSKALVGKVKIVSEPTPGI
jgi:FAD:protein FMN transferase